MGADPNVKKEIGYYPNNLVRDINSYDYNGQLLARSEFEYDARGRVAKVTQSIDDVNQAVTVYDYNDAGLVYDGNEYQIRITDANDKETYIALDAFGRRIEILYPSDDYQQLEYNPDGTLKRKAVFDVNDEKQWIEYFYDDYGRLTDVNYPDGNVHYTYDGFGRKILAKDSRNDDDRIGGTGQITYDYDVLDRIVKVTDQNDYEIIYTYTADGQKVSIDVNSPSPSAIYSVRYYYDAAGRLANVNEPLLPGTNDYIVEFDYDKNGNRSQIRYFLTGDPQGSTVTIDYTYNLDNLLTGFETTGGPTFELTDVNVDGLGRLAYANETLTKPDSSTVTHSLQYEYDMLSQLTDANITNVGPFDWIRRMYCYDKAGNMTSRVKDTSSASGTPAAFNYSGDLMKTASGGENFTLTWNKNGNMTLTDMNTGNDTTLEYNWDNKLRSATKGSESFSLKYDPFGNRIWKDSTENGTRKYIVDIVGDLPTILLEIHPTSGTVRRKHIYANGQIIMQHGWADNYFYLHDRLGSVRELINDSGEVVNYYTYTPFGKDELFAGEENTSDPFKFTGQWFDDEIGEYYLRARMYNPHIGRFTSRDPVAGKFKEPLTLHRYLYCINDPVNMVDPEGRFYYNLVSPILTGAALYGHGLNLATYGASSEDWRFFDLAESTFKFMPVGMAVAAVSPTKYFSPGWLAGLGMGAGIEWATDITGMGYLETGAMDYWAYLLYASYIFSERAELEILPWDMHAFLEWKD